MLPRWYIPGCTMPTMPPWVYIYHPGMRGSPAVYTTRVCREVYQVIHPGYVGRCTRLYTQGMRDRRECGPLYLHSLGERERMWPVIPPFFGRNRENVARYTSVLWEINGRMWSVIPPSFGRM